VVTATNLLTGSPTFQFVDINVAALPSAARRHAEGSKYADYY